MEQRVLCSVTAAARAAAFKGDPHVPERGLAPPHPAFVGFRRMSYVWIEGDTLHPLGGLPLWIDFLRKRGASTAWLRLHGRDATVASVDGDASSWRVSDDELSPTMRGSAEASGRRPEPDLRSATRELTGALRSGADAQQGLQREVYERGLAILASSDDGSEVSDVAWPHFVLPEVAGYSLEARRLIGAALTAWPAPPLAVDGWSGYDPWPPDPVLTAARAAVMTAVNSFTR
ncbi:MAG: hypothetical protein ABR498_08135 [Candidatus Dormibacteria bacterium]